MKTRYIAVLGLVLSAIIFVSASRSDKIKLQDVEVLTLKVNRMTTGRRSAPVPQLKCLENCHATLPRVVQCVNRGWDGSSVQWECKADMEEGYKFGDLAVICEGYDYPDDPYILTGSCGLEYTLHTDKKSSGYEQQNQNNYGWKQDLHKQSKPSGFQNIIVFLVLAGIVFALYKTCIAQPNVDPTAQESTTSGDFPPDDRQYPNMGWNIPGMGSRGQGYTGNYADNASCGAGQRRGRGGNGGFGGFWTGLATGGLAGYMFGNRGGNQQQGYRAPGSGSSFFGQSTPSSYSSSSFSSAPRTSTSTGFADTRRR